ncbi:Manganese ABC transporter substrate-binding lipoprotein [Commensalibacter sp. Nvir]|uniref:metal ABC transporter solute-binding protein, Zn/Mn family n=1 Tax=Commensalibacter sp. Nvir TaxID=3069817 RepID=UPI002D5F5047|nr:Manganese ABC transporter substrate-binding lipoprotein [Commensalibacter sp. Nvir]
MKLNHFLLLTIVLFSGLFAPIYANASIIQVVAAENMYGNVAQQLGGQHVQIDIILNNPDEDPHLFELTPNVGKTLSQAEVIIKNGLGYDSWIDRLLNKYNVKQKHVISVQQLLKDKDGGNPHLWYNIASIEALSNQLTLIYKTLQPEHKSFFTKQHSNFINQLVQLNERIKKIKSFSSKVPIAATEPVFGLMAKQLGFIVKEEPYQWTVMNNGEPTAKQMAQFQQDLKSHSVKILFYNNQVVTPATEQLKKLAEQTNIPVIGVSELMPASLTYQSWMNQVLDEVENVLKKNSK